MKITLTTLNSRYTHSSIGLRYIYANLDELKDDATILEFSINDALQSVAEKLLNNSPATINNIYSFDFFLLKKSIANPKYSIANKYL